MSISVPKKFLTVKRGKRKGNKFSVPVNVEVSHRRNLRVYKVPRIVNPEGRSLAEMIGQPSMEEIEAMSDKEQDDLYDKLYSDKNVRRYLVDPGADIHISPKSFPDFYLEEHPNELRPNFWVSPEDANSRIWMNVTKGLNVDYPEYVADALVHETIHQILNRIADSETSHQLDNIDDIPVSIGASWHDVLVGEIIRGRKYDEIARSTGNREGSIVLIGYVLSRIYDGWTNKEIQDNLKFHSGKSTNEKYPIDDIEILRSAFNKSVKNGLLEEYNDKILFNSNRIDSGLK